MDEKLKVLKFEDFYHFKVLLGAPQVNVELHEDDYYVSKDEAINDYELFKSRSPLTWEQLDKIDMSAWVNKYILALLKEKLGRIRSKFDELVIPGSIAPIKLDGEKLLLESEKEKMFLASILLSKNLQIENSNSVKNKLFVIYYISVGNLPDADIKGHMNKLRLNLSLSEKFYDVQEIYIPTRDFASRVEFFSTFGHNKEEEIIQMIEQLKKDFEQYIVLENEKE